MRYIYIVLIVGLLVGCDTTGKPTKEPATQPLLDVAQTATPLTPTELLEQAQQQQEIGEYDLAAGEYQSVITQYPESPEARVAEFGLAHSAFLRQDWMAARSLLEAFINQDIHDAWHSRALFLIARVSEEIDDPESAIEGYNRYTTDQGPLIGYAHLRRAVQLEKVGRFDQALAAYESAGASDMAGPQRVEAFDQAITYYEQRGDQQAILRAYEAILSFAQSPSYRPMMLTTAAELATTLGMNDQAQAWYGEVVKDWSSSGYAPGAVNNGRDTGLYVDPYQAGTIFYIHGFWESAIREFDQALQADLTTEQRAEARRKRALCIREQSRFDEALAELSTLANEQPDSPIGRQARLDAIQTYGQIGDRVGAIERYREFAATYSDDALAPEALRRVVEIVSWSGDDAAVNNARLYLGERYPWSREGQEALHDAGFYAFRTRDYPTAFAAWKLLGDNNIGLPQSQGYYWAGRTAANMGDQDQGYELLQKAYHAYPDSYYGARAADLTQIQESSNIPLTGGISEQHITEARAWIATWSTVAETDPMPLDVAAFQQRAYELEFVGLPVIAREEWFAARDAAYNQPFALFDIGLASTAAHAPYPTVLTARALMALVPEDQVDTPIAIRQLLYPTPYATAVINYSLANELDPRLLYALMRQESIFNPDATSWVGARGLAQVMPATGQGIAQNLGIDGFQEDDLYNPVTSIRFGAFYIAAQQRHMNGSVHAALAAYNGGPSNAERWANGNDVPDPDRFLATIDFPETEHYVEIVYSNYGAYRRLYGER